MAEILEPDTELLNYGIMERTNDSNNTNDGGKSLGSSNTSPSTSNLAKHSRPPVPELESEPEAKKQKKPLALKETKILKDEVKTFLLVHQDLVGDYSYTPDNRKQYYWMKNISKVFNSKKETDDFMRWTGSLTVAEIKAYGWPQGEFQGINHKWEKKIAKEGHFYVVYHSLDKEEWEIVGVLSYGGVCNLDTQGVPAGSKYPKYKGLSLKNLCTVCGCCTTKIIIIIIIIKAITHTYIYIHTHTHTHNSHLLSLLLFLTQLNRWPG